MLARLVDTAARAGYHDPFSMSPRQLFEVTKLSARHSSNEIMGAAVAARVSQGDKRAWQKFVKSMED